MEKRSNCPISFCLDHIGDKWSLLILRDVLMGGKKYFKEFASSEEGIATNLLSKRLKMLVEHGFLECRVDPVRRNMKVYSPTTKAKDLLPIILDMMVWSSKYGDFGSDQPSLVQFVGEVEKDREAVLAKILARFASN